MLRIIDHLSLFVFRLALILGSSLLSLTAAWYSLRCPHRLCPLSQQQAPCGFLAELQQPHGPLMDLRTKLAQTHSAGARHGVHSYVTCQHVQTVLRKGCSSLRRTRPRAKTLKTTPTAYAPQRPYSAGVTGIKQRVIVLIYMSLITN